jgi:hypothetical protein
MITSSTTTPAEMPTQTSTREEWLFILETMMTIRDVDVVDVVAAAITVGMEEAVVVERATRLMKSQCRNECMLREQLKMKTMMLSF